ncbi:dihydrolipoyl dehydrogenase [Pseudoneobacillus sp. C159]
MVVGELAHEREVVIIGGGPGGYHAAIRAAQLGKKVTLIEKNELGGMCLNEGCIPSKILTTAAARLALFSESNEMGIGNDKPSFEYTKLRQYQKKVIEQLKSGVKSLIQANKIELVIGNAYFLSENRLGIDMDDRYEVFQFNQAIIATGSQPTTPAGIIPDGELVFDIGMILKISEIPKHLLIYGNDENALEMASTFRSLGSEVTILMEQSNFGFDSSIEKELKRLLKKKQIQVLRNTVLIETKPIGDELLVELTVQDEKISLNGTHLLIATRRLPNSNHLGIEKLGITLTEEGFIKINQQCQTTVPTIYAIGDVTEGPLLAVKAIHQGKVAAESISGRLSEFDSTFLPKVVHFQPPIATVGFTEEEAKEQGYGTKVGQFPLASNGFATLLGKKDGLIKVISDAATETVLGVHAIGEGSIELISSGTLALEMVAREEDLKFPFYPHPSMNEGLLEAIEALNSEAIHVPPIRKKITT